jgi:hypothetical protein
MIARMATATQELPRYFEIVANIETNWKRYVVYASLAALVFAYLFELHIPTPVRGHDLRSPTPTLCTYLT